MSRPLLLFSFFCKDILTKKTKLINNQTISFCSPGSVLYLIIQIFLYLEAFECNTTSDWLNQMVQPIRSCVTFHLANIVEKDKECC